MIFNDLINIDTSFYTIIFMLIYLTATYISFYYRNKKYEASFYNRDIPKIHPALINYYNEGKITNKLIRVILLNLINKEYYKLERINNNGEIDYKITWIHQNDYLEVNNLDLKPYEKDLIKLININFYSKTTPSILYSELNEKLKADLHLLEKTGKIIEEIKYDIKKEYGEVSYRTNYFIAFLISIFYYLIFFNTSTFGFFTTLLFSSIILIISICLKNTPINIKGIMGLIILIYTITMLLLPIIPSIAFSENSLSILLILFNPLLLITTITIIKTPFYSKQQQQLIAMIKGFKNFLLDFTRLKHREVDYINFVQEYYTLAEALNVKMIDQEYIKSNYDDAFLETLTAFEFNEIISEKITNSIFGFQILENIEKDSKGY